MDPPEHHVKEESAPSDLARVASSEKPADPQTPGKTHLPPIILLDLPPQVSAAIVNDYPGPTESKLPGTTWLILGPDEREAGIPTELFRQHSVYFRRTLEAYLMANPGSTSKRLPLPHEPCTEPIAYAYIERFLCSNFDYDRVAEWYADKYFVCNRENEWNVDPLKIHAQVCHLGVRWEIPRLVDACIFFVKKSLAMELNLDGYQHPFHAMANFRQRLETLSFIFHPRSDSYSEVMRNKISLYVAATLPKWNIAFDRNRPATTTPRSPEELAKVRAWFEGIERKIPGLFANVALAKCMELSWNEVVCKSNHFFLCSQEF